MMHCASCFIINAAFSQFAKLQLRLGFNCLARRRLLVVRTSRSETDGEILIENCYSAMAHFRGFIDIRHRIASPRLGCPNMPWRQKIELKHESLVKPVRLLPSAHEVKKLINSETVCIGTAEFVQISPFFYGTNHSCGNERDFIE
jgi:hypothetical protein